MSFKRFFSQLAFFSVVTVTFSFVLTPFSSAQEAEGFQTPSGNISCAVFEKTLRCDLLENTAKIPPRPHDCDVDWGNFFEMKTKGKALRICAGDTVGKQPVLEYGKLWKHQGFTCQSEAQGLTCKNLDGKGWKLRKNKQDLF